MDELEHRIEELREREELEALRPELDGSQVMEHLGVAPDAQEPLKSKDKPVWKGFKLPSGANPSLSATVFRQRRSPSESGFSRTA